MKVCEKEREEKIVRFKTGAQRGGRSRNSGAENGVKSGVPKAVRVRGHYLSLVDVLVRAIEDFFI